MDKRDILQRIIDNEGSCDYLYGDNKEACASCPMSKMKTRKDGTYLSCWDALGLDETFGGYVVVNKLYYDKAIELLSDIIMDDMLRGKNIAKDT